MIKLDQIDIKILELTEKETISGEILASIFNISRTAIWKRIKKLEKLGYNFSHTPEGYKLKERTSYLLENEIKPLLKTRFIGKNYIFFEEIDSTNIFAKNNNLEEGTAVVAESQTAGKGRKGRKWISVKEKGIYFSIVLKPNISIDKLLKFSLIFPLSVHKTILNLGIEAKIKWPNDIFINGKKVAGILTETDIEGSEIKKAVVGIGININHADEDLEEIQDIATSLLIEKREEIDRKIFFAKLLENAEKYYLKFLEDKLNPVKEVEKYLLWKGSKVKLIEDDKETVGILKGLNKFGGLSLIINNKTQEFYTGDLTIRHI